jgi:putative transcriptional regulator
LKSLAKWLTVACGLIAADLAAGAGLGKGALLVAARDMQSSVFAETVILLLDYGADTGAMGLIVNHPTSVQPAELLPELQGLKRYRGPVYLGGPVEMYALLALLRADKPQEGAMNIFGHVHLVSPETSLMAVPAADASRLRFYVGYAGWAPGQLEIEIARGDWHVRAATEDVVFAKDAGSVWGKLVPAEGYRTASFPWKPATQILITSPPRAG